MKTLQVFLGLMCVLVPLAVLGIEADDVKLQVPATGVIKVAFVVSDDLVLIDMAGPMQTFDQVQSPGTTSFQTYTVAASRAPIKAGSVTLIPNFTFEDAPTPDIVVVGGQSGHDEKLLGYLTRMANSGKLMISVCIGASQFARAGLLDNVDATTHHDVIDAFQQQFPKTHFLADRAWVHSAPRIFTAGGETSGIELALHIIELYFDHDVAIKTARYMEYRSTNWAH